MDQGGCVFFESQRICKCSIAHADIDVVVKYNVQTLFLCCGIRLMTITSQILSDSVLQHVHY